MVLAPTPPLPSDSSVRVQNASLGVYCVLGVSGIFFLALARKEGAKADSAHTAAQPALPKVSAPLQVCNEVGNDCPLSFRAEEDNRYICCWKISLNTGNWVA